MSRRAFRRCIVRYCHYWHPRACRSINRAWKTTPEGCDIYIIDRPIHSEYSRYGAIQHNTAWRSATQQSTSKHSKARLSTAGFSSAQHGLAHHTTTQDSAAQHRLASHSSAQRNKNPPPHRTAYRSTPQQRNSAQHVCPTAQHHLN